MSSTLIRLKITDLSRAGSGVGKDESGRVLFVPLTAPGDEIEAQIVREEKRFAYGELVRILTPSPLRVTPPCPVFGKCGGCQWQHISYDLQWKTKFEGVKHALKRVQVESPKVWDELPADEIWHYRNRVQLRGFKNVLGFYARGTQEVVDISHCEISRPEINEALEEVRREGAKLPEPYKVELDVLPNGVLRRAWNSKHSAMGFRQVHDAQNAKLQKWVLAAVTPGRVVYDLFGGSGNLSMPLLGAAKAVHCVDLSIPKKAVQQAPDGLSFHRAAVSAWLKNWPTPPNEPASAVMDPPREGLGGEFAVIEEALRRLHVHEALLVGCDPDSWARDVSRFVRRGWTLKRAGVLDLFPQTAHVESIALLVL